MRIYSLNPDSTTEKTAIMYALSKGYQFKLTDQDGTATVTNSKGEVYNIENCQCDCADSLNRDGGSFTLGNTERHVCKHQIWVSQLYPCKNCKGYMVLRNEAWKVYQCCTPACYTMTPFQLVKAQRQEAYRQREQEADPIKTHTPTDTDAVIAKAEEASNAIFGDEPTPDPTLSTKPKFTSQHGIYYTQDGDVWKVYCVGFFDSSHATEEEAEERATRLEIFEESHTNKRTRINYA